MNIIKSIQIVFFCLFSIASLFSQKQGNGKGGQKLQAQMVAYLTNELSLTPQEAEKFWPVYNEYRSKDRELKRAKIPSKPVAEMNEAEASAYLNQNLDSEAKELELKRNYTKEFRKILPAVKVAKLQVAERGFKKELIKKISR